MTISKIKSTLTDVPETMLWALHNRAVEAMRTDGIIKDEKAIEIYNSINYDYKASFGVADASHAVRSIVFDREMEKFLRTYPDGTIVNLGEGLETQRFRVREHNALWLTIDLPEAIQIREQFIQPDERHLHIPLSAFDRNWFDYVPKDKPVFITAQGLFLYFPPEDVKLIMQDITNTFNQGYLMFDFIPRWLSNKSMSAKGWQKTKNYTTPKMPWGVNRNKIESTLNDWLNNTAEIVEIGYDDYPRGINKWLWLLFSSIAPLKNIIPSIVKLSFTPKTQ